MNETKKLGAHLASNPHSRRFSENTPGYTRIQYRHQEALWTYSLYITKTTKASPGRRRAYKSLVQSFETLG